MPDHAMPMFPLGRALLPGEALTLRVFEPRYIEMMEVVRASDPREFGVVLIARGWETGGGDDRYDVGTVARVAEDIPLGDEQRAVVAVGTEQFGVDEWLPDDPYPTAHISRMPGSSDVDDDHVARLGAGVRRLYALASELGADTGGQDLSLPQQAEDAVWRLGSLIPLAEYDRQRLLELDGHPARLALMENLLGEVTDELTMRLGGG